MDQAAGHMETESQKPENQQNGKDCPEHIWPSLSKSSTDKMGQLWRGVAMTVNTLLMSSAASRQPVLMIADRKHFVHLATSRLDDFAI
jgi:hypothetical protein